MPTNDFTSKLLDMEDAIIEKTDIYTDHINIHFSLRRRTQTCPVCGSATDKVHDYRTSVIKDIAATVGISNSTSHRWISFITLFYLHRQANLMNLSHALPCWETGHNTYSIPLNVLIPMDLQREAITP